MTEQQEAVGRQRTLIKLVFSLLRDSQIMKLRTKYALGEHTIAELSRLSLCPPVLLYAVLTPLSTQTAMKLRMLRIEKQVTLLRNRGFTSRQIAARIPLPLRVVLEYTEHRFDDISYFLRPWYNDMAPKRMVLPS